MGSHAVGRLDGPRQWDVCAERTGAWSVHRPQYSTSWEQEMANRRLFLVTAAAVLVSLTMVGAVVTPASARVITPSGNVTCRVSGSLSFSPPLTPGNGTPNVSNEVISTSLALSGCTGSSNPVGQVPTASTSVVTKAIKIKAIKIGRTKIRRWLQHLCFGTDGEIDR